MKSLLISLAMALLVGNVAAQPSDPARDREMRERYELVLMRNPFQERAFAQVYESYSRIEGVDAWVTALKGKSDGPDRQAALLLLGQVYDRQFKTPEAIAALAEAAAQGEERPQFKILLGTLFYKTGRDDEAAQLLNAALDTLSDLDQRGSVCRMLGNLFLRQGKREQAIAVWKRIAEQSPGEIFAQLELAEIYEDNRMWPDAIAVYRQIADASKEDPYRRCRALRSIAQCLVQSEKFPEAIATFEQALELVSPGNWLFEDLKMRLVGVYEDIGDLAGLARYVTARLEQNPGDLEFRDLLAETCLRMSNFEEAEKQYREILARNPRSASAYERLLRLHTRTGNKDRAMAALEKLVELFPADTDYLRRLGEFHLRDGQPEKAKETWRRIAGTSAPADRIATLAGWFETYDFAEDAVAAYEEAIGRNRNKDWVLRLAALRFQKGEENEAIALWLSVIDPEKSKVEDYAEIASIFETHQKLEEALKLRQAAVQKDGSALEARLAYGKLLLRQQDFEEASEQFEVLAAQHENEFMMHQGESGLIDCWRELGTLDEKQKEIEAALTRNPADSRLLGRLARLLERTGQRDKAIALYEARREKEPGNVEHLRALATLYKNSRQTEQAIASYTALIENDRNRARVYQKELLDIYLSLDLRDEAIAAGEQYVSLAPSDAEARLALAQVYQMYRQPEKALNEYRFALRLEPNEPDYHRQYGEALEQEKRFGEAQEAYRKMLDVAKEDSTRLTAVANLARIHLHQDRLEELASEFQRRIRNTPKRLAAYEELAAIYKEAGQILRSVEVLESGLHNIDDKAAALKSLIRVSHEAQDFPKVKSYFEQLVGMAGKPTANEQERLGQIYAQLGEIEQAKAVWNLILEAAPKDPKAHDRVSKLLLDHGFTDEAIVVRARGVELDPGDFKRRFEYAQLLARNQQPTEALEQVRLLLELGDREEQQEKQTEKKVQRVARGQVSGAVSPYQFMHGARYSTRYWGGSWQGNFRQFRPSVLQFMASTAQQSIGEEAFIKEMQERASGSGASVEAQRDLLMVLQMFNRVDEAVEMGERILAGAPNDPELLQMVALLYSNQQQTAKAIPLLEKLAAVQPRQKLAAASGLVPLYLKNNEPEKALATVEQILKESSGDLQTYFAMSSILMQNARFDEAKQVLTRLMEIDPLQTDNVRNQLANLAKQSGKIDEARQLFREVLLSESQQPAYLARSRRIDIYTPEVHPNQNRYYGNPLQSLPNAAFGGFRHEKMIALQEFVIASRTGSAEAVAILEEMEKIARSWSLALSPAQRDRAWEMARLLTGHWIIEKQFDRAESLLADLRKTGFEEAGWFNASIYLAQQQEDFSRMIALYDEMQQRHPARGRDLAVARTHTHLIARNFDQAAGIIRNLNEQRVPPAQILALIGALRQSGEARLARELLEDHLGGVSRNPQALSMLASIYAEEHDFEKAIALADEAWNRQAHGSQGSVYYNPGYQYMPRFGNVNNLLNELYRYYVGAGRSEELIERFKSAVEKQPGSVRGHDNLAAVYRFSEQRDKALEVYQQLAEKRPHLLQVKRSIAGLYQEMGQFDKATQFYEDLIKANPNLYQSFQWDLRWAYQRQGKGKELQEMEDKIASQARDPNQLLNLGYRLRDDGELDKAVELFRRAVRLSPGQAHVLSQLASTLVDLGEIEDARQAYDDWFRSPQLRMQGFVDHTALTRYAGLYKATGRLDELKARCEEDLQKNATDRSARTLLAHIAFLEKRYDDALALFKAGLDHGTDPNLVNSLIELAGYSGKFAEVLEVAERVNATVSGGWSAQQMASLYLAAGNKEKAVLQQLKWAEEMINQGNAGWAVRETMQSLSNMEMWDAAEQFVAKHRTASMDQYEGEEMDRTIAQQHVGSGRFEAIVESVLAKDSLRGRDLSLVQRISEAYQQTGQADRRKDFLERLVAADPRNRDLTFNLAQLYSAPEEQPKRLLLLESLVSADPAKVEYRQALAETLIELGRAAEAIQALETWVNEKPAEQRWMLLSDMQAKAGRPQEARRSILRAQETADPMRKAELELRLAAFDSRFGSAENEKRLLAENFQRRKDAQSFQRYWRFLNERGWGAEAHALFVEHKDSGYFSQHQNAEFATVCLENSDPLSAADLSWKFTRYGNRWEREWYGNQTAQRYRTRGKLQWFARDLAERVQNEAATHSGLQATLARTWIEAGYPLKALEIFEAQFEKNRFNRTALQNKAAVLMRLNRHEEAIHLLRDPVGMSSLEAEAQSALMLVDILFRNGRPDEAHETIEALVAWDKRANTLLRIATTLLAQNEPARAVELLDQALSGVRNWEYDSLLWAQATARAKLGNYQDIEKIAGQLSQTANAEWRLDSLQNWLISQSLFDLARQLIDSRIARTPQKQQLYLALASVHKDAGRPREALRAFERAGAAVPVTQRPAVRTQLVQFIVGNDLLREAMQARDEHSGGLLDEALALVLQQRAEKEADKSALAGFVARLRVQEPELQLALADAMKKLDRETEAAAILKSALNTTNEFTRVQAALQLAQLNGDEAALPVLRDLVQSNSFRVVGETRRSVDREVLIRSVARLNDPELVQQTLEVLNASTLHPSEADYYAALMAHHRGLDAEARMLLGRLAETPKLKAAQLQNLAKLLEERNMAAERIEVLQRLAGGGYSTDARWRALEQLVITHAKAQAWPAALAALQQMHAVWTFSFGENARRALADGVDAAAFPAFRLAVLESVRARPDHDAASSLIGLCQQIAQRIGIEETAASLAAEAGLAGDERDEAIAWDGLIEQWEIAGPYRTTTSSQSHHVVYNQEGAVALPSTGMPAPVIPESATWKATDPRHELGIISFPGFFGLDESECQNQFAYARTTIHSPESRLVTICAGSDDTIEVWVNGEQVHASSGARSTTLDQDRFTAQLKEGSNAILLKIGNQSGGWSFCLRIAEGAAGMTLAAR